MTYADLSLQDFAKNFENYKPGCMANYESLNKIVNLVEGQSKIKDWLRKRPNTKFWNFSLLLLHIHCFRSVSYKQFFSCYSAIRIVIIYITIQFQVKFIETLAVISLEMKI